MFLETAKHLAEVHEDMDTSQRGEGCSTAKEGGPFSLWTRPLLPYGGN